MKTTLHQVRELWAIAVEKPFDHNITAETRLRSSEDEVDSLDLAEFFMSVEEAFDIELPDHIIACLSTLGDVSTRVDAILAKRANP